MQNQIFSRGLQISPLHVLRVFPLTLLLIFCGVLGTVVISPGSAPASEHKIQPAQRNGHLRHRGSERPGRNSFRDRKSAAKSTSTDNASAVVNAPAVDNASATASTAAAQLVDPGIITGDPQLPPDQSPDDKCEQIRSHYVGEDVHALFPGGIDFSNPRHYCFRNVSIIPTPDGELEFFDSTVEGIFDFGSGPQLVRLDGPVSILVFGKTPTDETGSWQTEILSMDLSGDVGGVSIQIRKSPVQPSTGQTSVVDIGGGLYQIDSFFDVFVEMSIAGGPFQPSLSGPGHMELERVTNGGVPLPTPDLPPEPNPPNCDRIVSQYVGADLHALFPNGIDFSHPTHKCFQNVSVTIDPATGDESETFDSIVEGFFDDGSGPQPLILTGPVTTIARGKGGATTGSWDTEIVSMSLSGEVGGVSIEIRESPSKPSPGRTSVTPGSDGEFIIDSFFDVFVEISIDGGPFQPQTNGAGRLELDRIPPTVTLPTPELPPESDPPNCDHLKSHYVGIDLHALFPNGIDFSNPIHSCFRNVVRSIDPATGDETETFDSIVEGTIDDGSGPQPLILTGPVTTVARGKGGSTTGSWDTEMVSMSLSGEIGGVSIEIRESPGLPSQGRLQIVPDNGKFVIDSFFDVFVEISIGGGPFQPQTNGAGRMTLEPVRPSVQLRSPNLPPERDPPNCDRIVSLYVGRDLHALFPGGIDFSNPIHHCFKNAQITVDPATGDETETVDSIVDATIDLGGGPQPIVLTGPVTTVVRGKGGATTGSWDTEIVSMSLSGDLGGISIEIRESPSAQSPGKTKVEDNGDGTFQIDSFFDIFVEISVDGGPFQPQTNGSGRMDLEPIRPSVDLPSADLPPESDPGDCDALVSMYAGIDVHALFPNGIDFSNPVHSCFEDVVVSVDPATGDETEDFDSTVVGIYDDGSGPQRVELFGPVSIVTRGKGGSTTGSWDTEMVSMSLSGDVGGVSIEIRESPSKPSPGGTTILDNGDGTFNIDSFFDVFVELSVNGGPFQPQTNGASRMDLQRVIPTVDFGSASLPPDSNPVDCDSIVSMYAGIDLHALFPNGIEFSNPRHKCFQNVSISIDLFSGGEIETFDSTLEGTFDDGSGPQDVTLTGPVRILTKNAGSMSPDGTYQTEMIQMDLSGDVGGVSIEIRESPSKPSPGQVRILDIGGGNYQIDSFFDVFVELSINGGPFQPQTNEASRMELIPVPEPSRFLMLLTGAPLLHWLASRKQRKRGRKRASA